MMVDELAEALLVEPWMGVVLRKDALERGVVALDRDHGVVHDLADRGLLGARLQAGPAGLLGNPEDVDRTVLVGVFGIRALRAVRFEFRVLLLEGIGDVFEENDAEHDVLVFGGVHVGAERIRRAPERGFETEIRPVRLVRHF
jgi:hypothetical protein